MLLLFIFPSLVFLWPLCAPLLSHPWSSHSFSPLALSFKNQVALGQQLLMGSCLSCGSLFCGSHHDKVSTGFFISLTHWWADKTLHFSLPFKKNGRNRPKLWQNDSWFEDYLTVIFCPQRRYLYSSRSNHNKFWWLAADIREMQTRKSCNFLRKVTICHWKSILKEVNWIPKNKIKIQ